MTAQQQAGAYEPRPGDLVTVRRYIAPTIGERELTFEHTGTLTEVTPRADGHFIRLDNYPDRIFTGYQFLGAGQGVDAGPAGPASLVTEVTPVLSGDGSFGRQLTPDATLAVDGSGCIVLVVTEPDGKLPRVVTVTNVVAWKTALDDARDAQHAALEAADQRRVLGMDERRKAEGKLTKSEAVEWLTGENEEKLSRSSAVTLVEGVQRGRDVSVQLSGMTYDGTYWRVEPTATAEQPAR